MVFKKNNPGCNLHDDCSCDCVKPLVTLTPNCVSGIAWNVQNADTITVTLGDEVISTDESFGTVETGDGLLVVEATNSCGTTTQECEICAPPAYQPANAAESCYYFDSDGPDGTIFECGQFPAFLKYADITVHVSNLCGYLAPLNGSYTLGCGDPYILEQVAGVDDVSGRCLAGSFYFSHTPGGFVVRVLSALSLTFPTYEVPCPAYLPVYPGFPGVGYRCVSRREIQGLRQNWPLLYFVNHDCSDFGNGPDRLPCDIFSRLSGDCCARWGRPELNVTADITDPGPDEWGIFGGDLQPCPSECRAGDAVVSWQ